MVQKMTPEQIDAVGSQFAVRYAVAPPSETEDVRAVTGPELEARGWVRVTDGLYRLP